MGSFGSGGITGDVDLAVGFPLSPATCAVPPVPVMSVRDSFSPEVVPPVGLAVGSTARSEMPLRLISPPASVASPGLPPSSSASRLAPDDGPPSSLAAVEYVPAIGTFCGIYRASPPP